MLATNSKNGFLSFQCHRSFPFLFLSQAHQSNPKINLILLLYQFLQANAMISLLNRFEKILTGWDAKNQYYCKRCRR